MFDQPWPVIAGAVLVVLFFVSLLTYALVVGVRSEKRERAAIAQRKQLDTQQMIRKMRERHQGSSLEGFAPAEQLVLTKSESMVVPMVIPPVVKVPGHSPGFESRLMALKTAVESDINRLRRQDPTTSKTTIECNEYPAETKPVPPGLYSDRNEQMSKKAKVGDESCNERENPHRVTRPQLYSAMVENAPEDLARRALGTLNEVMAAKGLKPIPPPLRTDGRRWVGIDGLHYDAQTRRLFYGDRAVVIDGWSAESIQQSVDLLTSSVRAPQYPASGVLLSQRCENKTLVDVYADGKGGTFTRYVEHFSKRCGYFTS